VQVTATDALYPFITTRPEEVEALAASGLFAMDVERDEWAIPAVDEDGAKVLATAPASAASGPVLRFVPPSGSTPAAPLPTDEADELMLQELAVHDGDDIPEPTDYSWISSTTPRL
ncbi:MAG: hypothetical protein M0Z94_20325, partial [Dehalococcoidales bacterium]|nr:hypothetical protein [Dehalococcoidales bacterium]